MVLSELLNLWFDVLNFRLLGISWWFLFLFPCQNSEGIFSNLQWEAGGCPKVKPHDSLVAFGYYDPQEFLTLILIHIQPPTIHWTYYLNVPVLFWSSGFYSRLTYFGCDYLNARVSLDFALAVWPETLVLWYVSKRCISFCPLVRIGVISSNVWTEQEVFCL